MARTFERNRLDVIRAAEDQFTDDMRQMAADIGRVLDRYAVGGLPSERVILNTAAQKNLVKRAVWREVVKPYFMGAGDDALDGTTPLSPFTRLIVTGIRDGIKNVVQHQLSIVMKATRNDPVVRQWLTGPRPRNFAREMMPPPLTPPPKGEGNKYKSIVSEARPAIPVGYDGFHVFVDENGYTLSDKVWLRSRDVQSRIDRLMLYHIQQGTAAVDIAKLLEPFLTGEGAESTTRKPYGRVGSYAARRLARTEITAAVGRAMVNANIANPWVEGTKWNLSPSHPIYDICDKNAAGGRDGVYDNDKVPQYPAHPHELCYLTPEITRTPAQVTAALRAEIDRVQGQFGISDADARAARQGVLAGYLDIRRMQGMFNAGWSEVALFNGDFLPEILGVVASG